MSDFAAFVQLGFRHIVSLDAMDHLLFLLVLAALYRLSDWRALLWAISAFTVGHSITLALSVTGLLVLPSPWIEFFIPVTIVLTAASNMIASRARTRDTRAAAAARVALVGLFGLIHGAGFANYLRELFLDSIALPLLGFNVGIELGQLAVLAMMWPGLIAIDRTVRRAPLPGAWPAFRVRSVGLSALVGLVAAAWSAERLPW